MAPMLGVVSVLLILSGAAFFLAGTVGLLRFPDVYCRLHALTKADNLGLGLVALGLILRPVDAVTRLQILLIWLLALAAAATVCHILARTSLREGVPASGVDAMPPVPGDRDGVTSSSSPFGDRGTR